MLTALRIQGNRMRLLTVVAMLVVSLSLAVAASATTPGGNGRMAFNRPIPGRAEHDLFTVRPDGSGLRNLTRSPARTDLAADWSPDGSRIAFASGALGRSFHIYVMRADGTHRRRIVDRASGDPAWSPNGRKLAFVGSRAGQTDIFTVHLDGSGLRRVTNSPFPEGGPQWSPDGEFLAFHRSAPKFDAVYLVRPDGSGVRRLTPRWLNAENPDWAPDGQRIVFTRSLERAAVANIYTIRRNGIGLHRVTFQHTGAGSGQAAYSPNGRAIVFVSDRTGELLLYRKSLVTGGVHRVTHSSFPNDFPLPNPDWGPIT
jgi:Tol biopolymer transport system component